MKKRKATNYRDMGTQQLDAVDREAYEFADASYLEPGKRQDIGDYEYDTELSNANTAVYHNKKTKKTHVANRGSTTAYDWLVSDAQIAAGVEGLGNRFNSALHTTQKAHDKWGYEVETSGHSLGGGVSTYVTEKLGDEDWFGKSTTFNSGVSSLGRCNYFSKSGKGYRKPVTNNLVIFFGLI